MTNKAEQKQRVATTWLQCQLPRADWDNLNARRLALKLTWADIIAPATKEYIAKLEAKAADASREAPAVATIEKQADKTTSARKTKRAKKAERKPTANELKAIEREQAK